MIKDTSRRQELQRRVEAEVKRYAGSPFGSHGAIKIIETLVDQGQLDAALLENDDQIIGAIKYRAFQRDLMNPKHVDFPPGSE